MMKMQMAIPITPPTELPTMMGTEDFLDAAGVGVGDGEDVAFWSSDNEFGGGAMIVFSLHGKEYNPEFSKTVKEAEHSRAICDRKDYTPNDTERKF
jgi:hypothetical protein